MLDFEKKLKGAFFTSGDVSNYLVNRVIVDTNQKILEPSFGDGSFVNAIIQKYNEFWSINKLKENFYGVEIREDSLSQNIDISLLDSKKITFRDFLSVEPFPVDVVIGNPPYVGLNKLPVNEQKRAQKLISLRGFNMQSSGSLWFPFVLHSCAFLKQGGTFAFVLPFEVTYVRYAKQLWKFLSQHFSELTIVRVYEDMFPNVDVETVLLIAKGYGGTTNFVNYEMYSTKTKMLNGMIDKENPISVESILSGSRPFIYSLLSEAHIRIIGKLRDKGLLRPITDFCKFKIGYVSADQEYFHPSEEQIEEFGLSGEELLPAIVNAKILKNENIGLSINPKQVKKKLFYPQKMITPASKKYIKHGEKIGVNQRFKCRQRHPWFITPSIETPDIILTVFGDKPRMYVNKGKYIASNSLLCGFIQNKSVDLDDFVASWYNSLTLLFIELKIHSLGGGVLVFIPGEADALEIIDPNSLVSINKNFYKELDEALKSGQLEKAYSLGDKYILESIGLSKEEICLMTDAVKMLRKWRNSRLRKNLELVE
ncbi:MAG: SAM-dependent DNA methyltransferase [Anaerolineales bacterium]|nr:SAM-dependent DNA methyltransferase [Anaerolineales bacterium]